MFMIFALLLIGVTLPFLLIFGGLGILFVFPVLWIGSRLLPRVKPHWNKLSGPTRRHIVRTTGGTVVAALSGLCWYSVLTNWPSS